MNFIFYSSFQSELSVKPCSFTINDLEKTIVSRQIKNVIKIHQIMRKLNKENIPHEEYFRLYSKEIGIPLNVIEKSLLSRFFNLMIKLTSGLKMEILFFSFDDFKKWLNGLATIVKNRNCLNSILSG
jgi:hypothetical protein